MCLVGAEGTTDRLAANLANWDDRVPIHVASRFYDVERWFRDRPGPRRWEDDVFGDVSGLDMVHLQCHFGLDTLALADAGARATGLDFSGAAITEARSSRSEQVWLLGPASSKPTCSMQPQRWSPRRTTSCT